MRTKVFAKPARSRVALVLEGEGPNLTVSLDVDTAERLANELKDAVKEALLWTSG